MTIDPELQKVLNALHANPELKKCILEMIETAADEAGTLNNGDDAEDAVISAIQSAGRVLLRDWAQKKGRQAELLADANPAVRPHEKKRPSGIRLLGMSG